MHEVANVESSALVLVVSLALFTLLLGCNGAQRVAKLEHDITELNSKADSQHAMQSFDVQQKCGAAAKRWFLEHVSQPGKDVVLLDYSSHFNSKLGKCFVEVYRDTDSGRGSSSQTTTIADVLGHSDYAALSTSWSLERGYTVGFCKVDETNCKSEEEFKSLIRPAMND